MGDAGAVTAYGSLLGIEKALLSFKGMIFVSLVVGLVRKI